MTATVVLKERETENERKKRERKKRKTGERDMQKLKEKGEKVEREKV